MSKTEYFMCNASNNLDLTSLERVIIKHQKAARGKQSEGTILLTRISFNPSMDK